MAKRKKRSRGGGGGGGGGVKGSSKPKRKPSPEITKRIRKPPVSIYTPPVPRERRQAPTPLNIEQAKSLKKNILEFSGFVWGERDKEKKKKNVVKKLDKCLKYRLLFLCNVLDIPGVNNSKMHKLDIVDKLVEFLEHPHAPEDAAPAENAEDDSERTISEEGSSATETDTENQENDQNEDEVEDGDDAEEEQSESDHENDEQKDEDEVEDSSDEEEEQSESAHENDEPKDQDEIDDGGDEEEEQSESAHENDEPKDDKDSTEAESGHEENRSVKKGSTSKEPARRGAKSAAKEKTKPTKRGRGKTNRNTSKKRHKK